MKRFFSLAAVAYGRDDFGPESSEGDSHSDGRGRMILSLAAQMVTYYLERPALSQKRAFGAGNLRNGFEVIKRSRGVGR